MIIAPQVTVIMPVFNAERYLKAAIDSVLNQTFQNIELLLINDGSTDGSKHLIESYLDPRIRLLDNGANRGLIYSRNRGLAEAKGHMVALLDSDDVAIPDRIALQYDYMSKNPRLTMTGGHAAVIDATDSPTGEIYKMPVGSSEIQVELLFRNVFVNSTVMYRKEAVQQIGGYKGSGFCEDYHLAFRLAERYPIDNLDEVLVQYRLHDHNISGEKDHLMLEGELEIVRYMHQRLDIPTSNLLQKTHLSFIRRLSDFQPQLESYFLLFKEIKLGNQRTGLFPQEKLNRELFGKWYELIRKSRSKKSLSLFFRKPLFNSSYPTPKMYRKMLKQAFGVN